MRDRPFQLFVNGFVRGTFETMRGAELEEERLVRLAAKQGRYPATWVGHRDWPGWRRRDETVKKE